MALNFGMSIDECLEGTGLSEEETQSPSAEHTTEQEIQVMQNFVRHAPEQVGLGAVMGNQMHVHAFGVWGFAILTSPTLRSAIDVALQFEKLSFLVADMRLSEDNEHARLEFHLGGVPHQIHRFVLERHIAVAINFFDELLQHPNRKDFCIETTDTSENYGRALANFMEMPVRPGAEVGAFRFPAKLLDAPLEKSDPVSYRFCVEQCRNMVEKQNSELPQWSNKVRDMILENIAGEHKIDLVADKLAVTERTLRRRLTEEGTTFRVIYTDARMAIANELISSTGLNVETVAWRVGYAEPASFVRAFAKKYGVSPSEVRKTQLAS